MSRPANPTPEPEREFGDAIVFEFTDVAIPCPPGTAASPRPGRPSKEEIEEFLRQTKKSADSRYVRFEDDASKDGEGRS